VGARVIALGCLCLSGLGLLVYAPWESVPFDILDYSELLPILRSGSSLPEHVADVIGYYRTHGRSNFLLSAFIAVNWDLFGEDPIAWRLLRASVMVLVIAWTLRLLLKLRVSAVAATCGVSLLVVTEVAGANWLRLTGEPLVLLLAVIALDLAVGYRESQRPIVRATAICALLMGMVLIKETTLICIPFVLLVALCWQESGRLTRPLRGPRGRHLILGGLGVTIVTILLVLAVARATGPVAYVRTYGSAGISAGSFFHSFLKIVFPLGGEDVIRSPFNYALVLFVALGWSRKLYRSRERRGELLGILGLMIAFPVAGALVYLPWGRFEFFYGFPFLLGPVLLVAIAVRELEIWSRRRWAVWLTVGVLLLVPALYQQRVAAATGALRHVNVQLAKTLVDLSGTDSIVVIAPGLPAQDWQGFAATLLRFSAVLDSSARTPPHADRLCEEAQEILQAPNSGVLISYRHGCGILMEPTMTIARESSYLKFLRYALAKDSIRADIIIR
jgi:hypothetical protein